MELYQRHMPKLANVMPRKKPFCRRYRMICFTSSLTRQLYHLLGTDIENSMFKYRVSYGRLTFMIKAFELLMKSCEKLFVHIPCATACSLEEVNFKV